MKISLMVDGSYSGFVVSLFYVESVESSDPAPGHWQRSRGPGEVGGETRATGGRGRECSNTFLQTPKHSC